MPETNKLGPLQSAAVKLGNGDVVFVDRGGELPDDLAPGEVERLARNGAFAQPARPVTMTVPEASVALTGYLPPTTTLATNPEEGDPVVPPASVVAITDDEPAPAPSADPKRPARTGR